MAEYDDDRPDFDDVFGGEPPGEPPARRRGLRGFRDRAGGRGRADRERPEVEDDDLGTGVTGQFSRARERFGRRGGEPADPDPEPEETTFFAEADDEPEPGVSARRRGGGARRRRAGGGRPRGRRAAGAGGGGAAVLQQPATRLLLGLVFLVILIIVITLAVQGCQRSALEDSYRSYMSGVAQIITESAEQGQALRQAFNNPDGDVGAVQGQVQTLAEGAQALVDRAEGLDPPDRLAGEQQALVLALEYRVGGVAALASALPELAGSEDADFAANAIAEQMQLLLASDVIYRNSFVEPARQAQEEDDISGVEVPESEGFLPNASLATVEGARQLAGRLGGGGGGMGAGPDAGADGSLRGLAITEVTAGETTLAQDTTTQVSFDSFESWSVTVENGGEFTEAGVLVTAELSYPSGAPFTSEAQIEEITAGETQTLELNIPPQEFFDFTDAGTLTITVATVPNETNPDNNTGTYPVQISID